VLANNQESLDDVIVPTIESLKIAITTYERQGGSVNVIVCDDGLQLLDEASVRARKLYYAENDLAYVARQPHGQDGFERRGKFKKAGNLNQTNRLSLDVEEEMDNLRPDAAVDMQVWREPQEKALYGEVLEAVLAKREGKTWASGNVRM
jgi:hypothetical protein